MPSQNGYSKMYKGTTERIKVKLLTEIDVGVANEYKTQLKNLIKNRSRKWFQTRMENISSGPQIMF